MKLLKYISHFIIGYIIGIVLASIYFKLIKIKWWYGLISPVIGGLGVAIISFIYSIIYFSVNGPPSF